MEREASRLQAILTAAAEAVLSREEDAHARAVHGLKVLMDAVLPKHLGLPLPASSDHTSRSDQPVIRSQIVYECADFELCIFVFPEGARLPLHDHPGMTVLTKVLYGSLSMRSFDWEQPLEASELAFLTAEQRRQAQARGSKVSLPTDIAAEVFGRPLFARRRVDTVLTPEAPTFCLRPSFFNIHSFEALSACAVLDLILPPYDDDAGRSCHYFTIADNSDESRPLLAVAEPEPGSLIIRGAPYLGPRLHPVQT
jgi:plant cysteine oxidase